MTTRKLLLFLGLAGLSLQQKDILKDFCRLWGHQTAVIDRKLYIDGGFVNYNPLTEYPDNATNTALLYADFDVNNQGMPAVYNNLTKPTDAPDVNGGILWPDTVNKMIYLYGGEYSQGTPGNFSLWSYDALYNKWQTVSADSTQAGIKRASYGAGVTIQDRAVAFYYGGWLSNTSVPNWGSQSPNALSTMLQYDMLGNTWTNSSGPDTIGRAEGSMVYIPASDGMLVYIGGVQSANNGTTIGQPMDEILLYDISGSRWYTQKATGDVPEQRRKFCAGATWAEDYSSYNIYLYGGLGAPEGLGFDDLYILTLPSFQWIKWYPNGTDSGYPKNSMSCTVVDGAQMLVMGGTKPNDTDCDIPAIYGMHNVYLGKQNPQDAIWALFRPNLTSYEVPTEIISAVGGSATGGANTTQPADGFDNRDLSVFFTRTYTAATRAPTRTIPTSESSSGSKSKHVGAIVGGVVGGVAGVSLLAALLFFYLRRRKKNSVPTEVEQTQQDVKDPAAAALVGGTGQDDSRPSELAGGYPGQQEAMRSELPAEVAGQRQSARSELGSSALVELEGDIAPYSPTSPTSPPSSPPPSHPLSPASPHRGS
ncbi:hypothetical protein BDV34DRAFT_202273 [Aspergillus parasiticus]|uniref:Uncharacterized protein n=2 Tax=Aspergillus subgen. Circumdati TaxID=2720871 RepID=A0A5N6D8R9_ASPPA|nr:hypothetical protein BDV34DRAFT_202273 [Aspergillus parasiticus]KAE8315093.1 hypothetical protein BDV41DRAFT_531855 [Aspergillus transmontanensis]